MHLQRDLDKLRKKILLLGSLVEEMTNHSMLALSGLRRDMIDEVNQLEIQVNEMEVDIEEDCLKILALHQPVATDLRFIILVLKVNNDLERMGDQAVNIGNRIKYLADKEPVNVDFSEMFEIVRQMVRNSLDSLVSLNTDMATQVMKMDDRVDEIHSSMFALMQDYVKQNPQNVAEAMSYLTISTNLERIGDLSTNIAEEVIFLEEGEVVRHQNN